MKFVLSKKITSCIDSFECPDDYYILDINGNKYSLCGIGKFFLVREGICNDTCDKSIYISKGYECGLCKQLFPSTPYKLINSDMCVSSFPGVAEIYDNDLFLLKCKSGYKLDGRTCSIINSENTEKPNSENIIESCPDNYVMDVGLNICVKKNL